jgi:hypothetical protein
MDPWPQCWALARARFPSSSRRAGLDPVLGDRVLGDRVLGDQVSTTTLVFVSGLARPEYKVEVDAWASAER